MEEILYEVRMLSTAGLFGYGIRRSAVLGHSRKAKLHIQGYASTVRANIDSLNTVY